MSDNPTTGPLGDRPELRWIDDFRLAVGDLEFVTTGPESGDVERENAGLLVAGSVSDQDGRFVLLKSNAVIQHYADLVAELAPRRILELGVFRGGGVALLCELAAPERLVAIEKDTTRLDTLERYCRTSPQGGAVRLHQGVDQADGERLGVILEADLGGAALDLVIDDASHQLEATRRSFELLFPRLRPGGLYIIEDWSWGAYPSEHFELGGTPLAMLLVELLLACATTRGLIADVLVRWNTVTVTRGDRPLDPDAFLLVDSYHRRWHRLLEEGPTLLDRAED